MVDCHSFPALKKSECRLESGSGMVHGEMDVFTKEGRLQKPMVDSLNDPATVKMSNLAEGYSVRSAEKEGAFKEPSNDSVSTVDDQRMGRSHEILHEKSLRLNGSQYQQSETPPRCNNKVGVGKNVGPFSSPIKRGKGRPRKSQKTNPNPSDAGKRDISNLSERVKVFYKRSSQKIKRRSVASVHSRVKRIKGDGAAADQVVEGPKTNRLETGAAADQVVESPKTNRLETGVKRIKGDGAAADQVVESPKTNRLETGAAADQVVESPKTNRLETGGKGIGDGIASVASVHSRVKRIKGDGAAADQVVESPKTNRLETGGTGIGDGIADDAVAVEDPGSNRADSREQVEKLLPLKIEREEVLGKQRWCITKKSPLWNTVEAMEAFKLFPQAPHFGPLERLDDEFQEGLAIGHMVTFSSLVDKALKLRPDDPLTSFDSILKALMELERHGFEVGPVQWRVDGLLVLKMKYERLMELSRGVQGRIAENQRKEVRAEEEIGEIEREMEELVVRRVAIASRKVAWASETGLLQAKSKAIDEELQLAHRDFQGMVAGWW